MAGWEWVAVVWGGCTLVALVVVLAMGGMWDASEPWSSVVFYAFLLIGSPIVVGWLVLLIVKITLEPRAATVDLPPAPEPRCGPPSPADDDCNWIHLQYKDGRSHWKYLGPDIPGVDVKTLTPPHMRGHRYSRS